MRPVCGVRAPARVIDSEAVDHRTAARSEGVSLRLNILISVVLLGLIFPRGAALAAVSGYSFSSTLRSYLPLSGSTTQVLNPGADDILSGDRKSTRLHSS